MKEFVGNLAGRFGIGVVSSRRLNALRAMESEINDLFDLALAVGGAAERGHAQLRQDAFVLLQTCFKRNGFFVEFGATNGIDLSNTVLLERDFGWQGILAEPATCWHDALRKNRSARIDTRCVWKESGRQLLFNMVDNPELSTIASFSGEDFHAESRAKGDCYAVETVTLQDLLRESDAPKVIDYLSVDTEGSEYDILSSFDFSEYQVRIITCEHNFTSNRDKIFGLLASKGYVRKFAGISKWDDWYVLAR